MSRRYLAVGIFIIAGVTLFALGIFLVGSRHEAFAHHEMLYTEFADLDGVTRGSKVQVEGMDAGQVTKIEVPGSPNGRFRVEMKVDERFHGMIRSDSEVTVDTEGVVGNTFLTIHTGSPNAPDAIPGSLLRSKPPVNVSDLLTHGLDVMNDADTSLKQLNGKINVTLDSVDVTLGNANDIIVGLKEGRGPAGMLLRDEKMAGQIRETLSNVQSATVNLKQASSGAVSMVEDVQRRQLPQKLDDTMTQIRSASTQAGATIDQLHQSLTQALGPDAHGVTAGQNISQSLSNANVATANMADDTEAIKHNLFFKAYFKHRGYYTLMSLSPQEYRRDRLFADARSPRVWLSADSAFAPGPHGQEELTDAGKHAIDDAIVSFGDSVFASPLVVEGYADVSTPADALASSYVRAQLIRGYLAARYPFTANRLGVMPLSATPPPGLGHERWSGACLVVAQKK